MKPKLLMDEMTREHVRQVAPDALVVLPTGSIEQHNVHLPIQTDTLLCETVCLRAAELASTEIAITVAPTVCFGRSGHHFPLPGVLSLSSTTFIQVLREVCDSLVRSGFGRIFIVNGHGGNDSPIVVAAMDVNDALKIPIRAVSYWTPPRAELEGAAGGPSFGVVPGHAGNFETSLVLAVRPDLVDGRPPRPDASGLTPTQVEDMCAALATPEMGERLLSIAVRRMAEEFVTFASVNTAFRTPPSTR